MEARAMKEEIGRELQLARGTEEFQEEVCSRILMLQELIILALRVVRNQLCS